MPKNRFHTAAMAATTNISSPISSTSVAILTLPETGFLRQPQVLAFVPISKSTLWRRIQANSFPRPVKLSTGITAWRAEEIRDWISQQGQSFL